MENVAALRHNLLELHKSLIDAQRIRYERRRGRIETSGEFLGLVLNHKDFEWIRSLSALIARLDEWAEEPHESDAEFGGIVQALRALIQPNGPNPTFNAPYWEMVEKEPDVTVAHVKVWRLVDSA